MTHFHVGTLEGLGLKDYDSGIIAAGALFPVSYRDTEIRPDPYDHHPALLGG